MARNNLSRLFPSISNLSTAPKLLFSPHARSESSSAIRLFCSSSSTQQPQQQRQPIQENASKDREETVKSNFESESKEDLEDDDDDVNKETGEVGGPRGLEPTRFGDWEKNGRCYDF